MHLETNVKMSKEVLDKLVIIFETKYIISNAFATIHFHSQKMNEIESVEKHLNSFNVLKTQLKVIKTKMVDE